MPWETPGDSRVRSITFFVINSTLGHRGGPPSFFLGHILTLLPKPVLYVTLNHWGKIWNLVYVLVQSEQKIESCKNWQHGHMLFTLRQKYTNFEIWTRWIKVTYRTGLASRVRICPRVLGHIALFDSSYKPIVAEIKQKAIWPYSWVIKLGQYF